MVDYVVLTTRFVCLVDLIRSITVWEQGQSIAILVDSIVKLRIIHWFVDKFDVKSSRRVWELSSELLSSHIEAVTSHVHRIRVHQDSLLVWIEAGA